MFKDLRFSKSPNSSSNNELFFLLPVIPTIFTVYPHCWPFLPPIQFILATIYWTLLGTSSAHFNTFPNSEFNTHLWTDATAALTAAQHSDLGWPAHFCISSKSSELSVSPLSTSHLSASCLWVISSHGFNNHYLLRFPTLALSSSNSNP